MRLRLRSWWRGWCRGDKDRKDLKDRKDDETKWVAPSFASLKSFRSFSFYFALRFRRIRHMFATDFNSCGGTQMPGFIPPHGGYASLLSYQKAEIVYDGTVYFCDRFIDRRSRTRDQMVQAARSGKQNIVEGSMASGTSKETEVKLTNVARASLEELVVDYLDFLRTRGSGEWPKTHPFALRLRELNRIRNAPYTAFRKGIEHPDPLISANVLLGLTRVTTFLLTRQLRGLEASFVAEGGLRERMTRARLAGRDARAGRP